jgi:dipeptidyl aminopeptidase/acylaminoacyl peptidase
MDMVIAGNRALAEPRLDGDDVYVLEGRPDEGGRVVLMRRSTEGTWSDVTAAPFNVRTRAHEYGGGAYDVAGGLVVFANFGDNRLYLQRSPSETPSPLTTDERQRFADLSIDRARDRVLAVLEDHVSGDGQPRNLVVAISLADGQITELESGRDFYSDPRLDRGGERLSWLSWDLPYMPWDGTELRVGRLGQDGALVDAQLVAGSTEESIVQPTWAPDGSLLFASDRTGWWNLYDWHSGAYEAEPIAPMEAEVGGPQWVFGLRAFAIDGDGRIALIARAHGVDRLLVLESGGQREVPLAATELDSIALRAGKAVLLAGSPTTPTTLVEVDLATGSTTVLRSASELVVDPKYLSVPRQIEFPTTDGQTAFAWFYPPTNPDVVAPDGELPPLVVMSHGGPTAPTSTGLNLGLQAFTSRGFAVVDVEYRGSTGYGRAYRDGLRGAWGIVDVDDCTNAATWLVSQGLADPNRLAIRGGSAGGFTTLSALAFRDVFSAGASHFGVGDLEALARDTHKFESRYLDLLVAPYPERVDVYRERSPIHFVDRIRCPVLVLQGEDDLVVPREQAEAIVTALRRNGIPCGYLLFPGEGHGFRKGENQRRAREAELSFYAQVFGFEVADDFPPVEVEGLSRAPR